LFTAYIDQVTFKDKGEVGDRIMLTSQCCRSFGGILEIEVKAEAYKAHEQPRLINVAYFCVSGVDGCGKPLLFADVIPETEDERSRFTMSQVLLLI
jgi:acyl-CoA hydrolase